MERGEKRGCRQMMSGGKEGRIVDGIASRPQLCLVEMSSANILYSSSIRE